MRRADQDASPPSSPARKRARLSSPTYDEQLGDLSQDDLAACDELEAHISQPSLKARGTRGHHPLQTEVHDDPDNPFITRVTVPQSAFTTPSVVLAGFSTARQMVPGTAEMKTIERSPSPEAPSEMEYDSWFQPTTAIPVLGFQTASLSTLALPLGSQTLEIGFKKASNKGWLAPSLTALQKAKQKLDEIWLEDNHGESSTKEISASQSGRELGGSGAHEVPSSQQPIHPVNRVAPPSQPPSTPIRVTQAQTSMLDDLPQVSSINRLKEKNKPFKSPLLSASKFNTLSNSDTSTFTKASSLTNSPLNPHGRSISQREPRNLPDHTKPKSISNPFTPTRPLEITPHPERTRKRTAPAPFVTPFKAGMKPGEPGHSSLTRSLRKTVPTTPLASITKTPRRVKAKNTSYFDLRIPTNRKPMAACFSLPRDDSGFEFGKVGINHMELVQMAPELAIYYSFHDPRSTPPKLLGTLAALDHLHHLGCELATKAWVDNHWCLVLWKLAGMVLMDPKSEVDSRTKRWHWSEVIRQLLYRYERELNGGIRPPFRLITTRDAPASYPMVLCVSGITWSEGGITDDGMPIEPYPELEVTDGWYKLRAQVDAPLARAIRRGVICVGRKLSVAGAKLSSERKEPAEVLECYASTKLVFSGNSSHLTSWDAKLGYRPGTCISTLHSLTADGGCVAAMDIVVVKAHPIAFVEFVEDNEGNKRREGPRSEADEAREHSRWQREKERHFSKLQDALEKKWARYEGYMSRLEGRAGNKFRPNEDASTPSRIETLYDELEEISNANRVIAITSPVEAGWLARHIGERLEKEKENSQEEIECELKANFPPRVVRDFRVVIVQDARTQRRPAHRSAQLTIWGVRGLSSSEGESAGCFEPGERYLVTNLIPTQHGAWMDTKPGSEIFLCTRQDSKWMKIRTGSF